MKINLQLHAGHNPIIKNEVPDLLSRDFSLETERMLQTTIDLTRHWSREHSCKYPIINFIPCKVDRKPCAFNPFLMALVQFKLYIFHQFSIIGKIVAKAEKWANIS